MQLSDRIGLRMKLHDLHVLMAVVQAGNMSKAAALLNTTKPAISRSSAELERTVGVRLLDRNSQGVEVTEYGRALLDGGTAAFDDLRQAVKNINFLADPTAGEVRIGCGSWLAPCLLQSSSGWRDAIRELSSASSLRPWRCCDASFTNAALMF